MKAGLFLFLGMKVLASFLIFFTVVLSTSCSQKNEKHLIAERFVRDVLEQSYPIDSLVARMRPRHDSVAFGYLIYWREQLKKDSISFSDLQVMLSIEAENKNFRILAEPDLFLAFNDEKIYLPMTVDDENLVQLKMVVEKGGRYFLLNFPE